MTATLSTDAVERRYRRGSEIVQAVDGVSITLRPGEVTLLEGPSGSGKSTLVHLLAGWERPDGGAVLWDGDAVHPENLRWEQLALVPQRLGLLPELSALENAVLPHRTTGRPDLGEATAVLLARLGLGDHLDARPEQLSGGQRQRVALARAVTVSPAVLIADEPTSAQDEAFARLVLGEIGRLAHRGSACLVASHDPIAVEYADRTLVMRDGRVTELTGA